MSKSSNKSLKLRAGISFVALNLIAFVLVAITVPVYAGVNKVLDSNLSNQQTTSNEEAPLGPYGDWNDEEMDDTVTPQPKSTNDAVSFGHDFSLFVALSDDQEDSSGYGDADPEDNS